MGALTWHKATARFGQTVEYAVTEHGMYVVDGSGYGRMRWSVDYPDGDGCSTDTKGDARANAESHHAEEIRRAAKKL